PFTAKSESICYAGKAEIFCLAVRQYHGAGAGRGALANMRNRKAHERARVKVEFAQVLANERDHAGIMRARAKLRKDDLVLFGDEKLHTEQAIATQIIDYPARHVLSGFQSFLRPCGGLPALHKITPYLPDVLARAYN